MGNVVRSRILCLGIDGAGKTAFIDKVQHPDQDIPTSPTDAYVVRDVKVKGVVLNVWDVAGRSSTRSLWKHYFAEGSTDAVIWVIDSSSSDDKLEESKQALASVLMDPNLSGTHNGFFLFWCVFLCVFLFFADFARCRYLAHSQSNNSANALNGFSIVVQCCWANIVVKIFTLAPAARGRDAARLIRVRVLPERVFPQFCFAYFSETVS